MKCFVVYSEKTLSSCGRKNLPVEVDFCRKPATISHMKNTTTTPLTPLETLGHIDSTGVVLCEVLNQMLQVTFDLKDTFNPTQQKAIMEQIQKMMNAVNVLRAVRNDLETKYNFSEDSQHENPEYIAECLNRQLEDGESIEN
jgi:hypothetical protein